MILYLRASLFLFLPYFFSFFLFLALCIVTCVYMLCIYLESSCFPGQSNHMSLWVTYSQVLAFAFKSSLSDIKTVMLGASLMAQWLRLQTSNAKGAGSNPCQDGKLPHATGHGQKIKRTRSSVAWDKGTSTQLAFEEMQ